MKDQKIVELLVKEGDVVCVLSVGRRPHPLELCVGRELPNGRCQPESASGDFQVECASQVEASLFAFDHFSVKGKKLNGRPSKNRKTCSMRLTPSVIECIDQLAKQMEVDRSTVVSYLVLKVMKENHRLD